MARAKPAPMNVDSASVTFDLSISASLKLHPIAETPDLRR